MKVNWLLGALLSCASIGAALAGQPDSSAFRQGIEEFPEDNSEGTVGLAAGYRFGDLTGSRFLVGIRYTGVSQPTTPNTAWKLFWVEASIATDANPTLPADAPTRIAGYHLRFVPLSWQMSDLEKGDYSRVGVNILPTDISRDLILDPTGSSGLMPGQVSVRILGVKGSARPPTDFKSLSVISDVLIDGIGLTWQHSTKDQRLSLHVIDVLLSVGVRAKIAEELTLEFRILNGGVSGGPLDVEMRGYSDIAIKWRTRSLEFEAYAKGGAFRRAYFWDAGKGNEHVVTEGFFQAGSRLSW